MKLDARFIAGVAEVLPEDWDRLVGDASPFLEWTFLDACEQHSALPTFGAAPQHLTVYESGRLVAAVPLYVKGDGRGEFIYDWAWYMLARRMGVDYYPKLLSMSPFTPVPAPHFLLDPAFEPGELLPALAGLVEDCARQSGMRGVHYLFLPEAEAESLTQVGYLRRLTYQLVWRNQRYTDFDAFLARFKSKDRVKIKRELRRVPEQGLRFETRSGAAIEPEDCEALYQFYARTCALYGTGSDYLKRGTWQRLFRDWKHRLVLFLAYRGSERVAGSLCVHKGDSLYGRYWGCSEELPGLYFNAACYQPQQYAIEHGIERFYAGFGNATYKHARGLDPEPTHSVHRLFEPRLQHILADALERERLLQEMEIREIRRRSKLRNPLVGP